MKTRFDRAVQALVSAYMNDTLEGANCSACAVGNMIAFNLGIKVAKGYGFFFGDAGWVNNDPRWQDVFCSRGDGSQKIEPEWYVDEAKKQIDSTGYTYEELAKVEKGFETSMRTDPSQFNALMKVVDLLCEIEGITDSAEYKALFAGKALAEAGV